MTGRGKIARLPREIREQLNRRLDGGEAGKDLVVWLNQLPEVKSVLDCQFGARPINEQNLSEWKAREHQGWLARQDAVGQAHELAADGNELAEATDWKLTDHLSTVLAARYAAALGDWDGGVTEEFRRKVRALHGLCRDIVELRRGDHSGARLNMERDRWMREAERTEKEVVEYFKRWATVPEVRELLAKKWMSPEERERRINEIFGVGANQRPEVRSQKPEVGGRRSEDGGEPIKPNQT